MLYHCEGLFVDCGCICFKARNYIFWNDIFKNTILRNNIHTYVFGKNLDFLEMF